MAVISTALAMPLARLMLAQADRRPRMAEIAVSRDNIGIVSSD
jgi:hypothetical protein